MRFLRDLRGYLLLAVLSVSAATGLRAAEGRPVRILFLGHESEHHNSNRYFPMLAAALGPDAIYFDYETDVSEALDRDYLFQFDGVLLYANHMEMSDEEMSNLTEFVNSGRGFIPVHCASACFTNRREFISLVGGQFQRHGGEVFSMSTVEHDHPAMKDVEEFAAWDETYVHSNHNEDARTVLQVRESDDAPDEPWTWVREVGDGRVFYTASGHDERVWERSEFHQLLKSGILWAVGETVADARETFVTSRKPLVYHQADFIPNYERRPEPLPMQEPLEPADSMDYTQVPAGYRLELFASEPEIINPICMAWDERGRLWVAETVDYPNEIRDQGGRDRIKILEDVNGDGRCDRVTIFADGFNIPTSLTFANGGVLVSHAPEMVFLKDTDGDDRADVREVLFTGFGKGDTHAGPSSLRYGFDNWIYGTVGYSRFRGTVGDERHDFGMGVFRFKPDGSDMEFLSQFNNNTWGVGFNSAGDVFGSTANNNPSFFGGIPESILDASAGVRSAKMIANSPAFQPITPNIRQVDAFGAYTAGCGHAFSTSLGFAPRHREDLAFVCGPTGHLLGTYEVVPDGAGFESINRFSFVASADEWFSPVAAEVGPDGALWIADWYNFIIQHNPTPSENRGGFDGRNGPGNAHVNPNRDRQHGRIYRLVWNGAPTSNLASLKGAEPTQLVAALEDTNLFWRQTAQRLLVESGSTEASSRLRAQVRAGGTSSIHALWALDGLGTLDTETLTQALVSENPALRRNAIRALGTDTDSVQLFFDSAVVIDPDLATRLVAFNKLSAFPTSESIQTAVRQLASDQENRSDEWLNASLTNAAAAHDARMEFSLVGNVFENPSFESGDDSPVGWSPRNYGGRSAHTWDKEVARSGSASLRIDSGTGSDTSWYQDVQVKPNTDYRLSAWIKTQGIRGAMGALLNIHESPDQEVTEAVSGNSDWTEVELFFNSGRRREMSINLLFGGWGRATGTAWWDDVRLAEVSYSVSQGAATTGDPERGLAIFNEHPIAACSRCHQLDGVGGIVGPKLDGIASRKTEDYLRTSLVSPSADIAEGFEFQASPMPPMGALLEPQDLEDLMAFLKTLK